jgi:hypothetical protein
MTTAGLKTVVLAHVGIQFIHAAPDGASKLGPRVREDDGVGLAGGMTR